MRIMGYKSAQCFQRLLRPILLNKANSHNNCHCESNADGIVVVAHHKRDPSRAEEEENQRLLELFEEPQPEGFRIIVRKLVRSVSGQAYLCLGGCQAM